VRENRAWGSTETISIIRQQPLVQHRTECQRCKRADPLKLCCLSGFFLKKTRNVTSEYALNEPVHNLTIRRNNFVPPPPPPKLTDVKKQHKEEFLRFFPFSYSQ